MTDYVKTGNPLQGTRGISKQVREEFSLIEEAIRSKADLDGAEFTSPPSAPTVPLSVNDDTLATTRFVNDKLAAPSVASIRVYRNVQNSSYTLDFDDKGNIVDFRGSSPVSYSFDSCAVLSDGWYAYIVNSGTNDVTLQPSGSEVIDGVSTFVMYSGEARLIQCDGATLRSIVLQGFKKKYDSSGSFIKPPGYKGFGGFIWSGGGGGDSHGGGGGGGCFNFSVDSDNIPSSETIIVGAGGAIGVQGGDSSFAGIIVTGGRAGATSSSGSGGNGGAVMINSIGEFTQTDSAFAGLEGGMYIPGNSRVRHSLFGGGAGFNGLTLGPAGTSIYGGGGGGRDSAKPRGTSIFAGNGGENLQPGEAPAGGGGNGASGARGEVIIWGVI